MTLTTPNLDELAAMSSAAEESNRKSGLQTGLDYARASTLGDESGAMVGTTQREGHVLAKAVIADGKLVEAGPLGPSLTAVMAAMLGSGALPASNGGLGRFVSSIIQTWRGKKIDRNRATCFRGIFQV